jgi:5'-methylthioadenosine phosphorylase
MPEAKLAREAEMCYALVAIPTDYDCWRSHDPARGQDELLREILGNLRRATDNAIALIHEALKRMDEADGQCRCRSALELAIWSDKGRIDPATRARLDLLIGHRIPDPSERG